MTERESDMRVPSMLGGEIYEAGKKQFEEEWAPKLFPHWWGIGLLRWLTRYFRITPKQYVKDYYALGFLEGAEFSERKYYKMTPLGWVRSHD